jgi:RNA polymerase sigma-70 factor (ECF subfamily)
VVGGSAGMATNETLTSVFLAFRSQLARVISRLVPPHDIEDIVQETYVRVCRFNSKLRSGRRSSQAEQEVIREPRALMVRVARNIALDHIKRADLRLTDSLDEDLTSNPELVSCQEDHTYLQAASDEEFSRFCEAVRQLPQQCRRVFVLKKVYGYSQQEIAVALGLSESTVEKHVAKGIRLCAEHIWSTDDVSASTSYERRRPSPGSRR